MTRRLLLLSLVATLAASAVTLPRPAGDLRFDTSTGPVLLSQYKGKVVAVLLVLLGCEHCHKAMQALNPIQRELGKDGLQVLVGAFNLTNAEEATTFARQASPAYPVGALENDKVVPFTQVTPAMKPTAPILVIVDRKGTVRAQYLGKDAVFQGDMQKNLRAELQKYLK